MPAWLFPVLMSTLLSVLIALVARIGQGFDKRIGGVEAALEDISKAMAKMELVLDRGERHESAIEKLQNEVSDLRVEVARWGGPN